MKNIHETDRRTLMRATEMQEIYGHLQAVVHTDKEIYDAIMTPTGHHTRKIISPLLRDIHLNPLGMFCFIPNASAPPAPAASEGLQKKDKRLSRSVSALRACFTRNRRRLKTVRF